MNNLHKSKHRAELIGEILSKPKKNGTADNNLFKNANSKDNVKVVDQNNDFDLYVNISTSYSILVIILSKQTNTFASTVVY